LVEIMDAQQTPTARLHLIAPLGQDAMGTHWRAVDMAYGREVHAHELTGAYTEWRPVLPLGHELVVDGGRVFVLAPSVGEARPRGPRTGLVVGIVLAAVLALVVVVGGLVVLGRGLAVSDGGTSRGAVPPPERRTGPVNVALLEATTGDCFEFDMSSFPSEPDGEFDARIVTCVDDFWLHEVRSLHKGVRRDEVAEISRSAFVYCSGGSGDRNVLIWASADGEVGTMICAD
jgi:hypothetical protein